MLVDKTDQVKQYNEKINNLQDKITSILRINDEF